MSKITQNLGIVIKCDNIIWLCKQVRCKFFLNAISKILI